MALAEWCYNTSLHSSTGSTPFEIIYGKPPPVAHDYLPNTTNNEAAQTLLESRQALHSRLKKKLQKAQLTMKHYADAKRDDVSFSVGQWVYVRLRPGRQTSISGHHHPKLSKRFFGPFQIEERIGSVAYRLRLPPHSQIHPVFHSSLLRAHHGPQPPLTDTWTLGTLSKEPLRRPLCFLDTKLDDSTDPPPPHTTGPHPVGRRTTRGHIVGPWSSLRELYHLEDKVKWCGPDSCWSES